MIDVDVRRYTDAKLRQEIETVDFCLSMPHSPCDLIEAHHRELRRFRESLEGERNRRHLALPLFAQAPGQRGEG